MHQESPYTEGREDTEFVFCTLESGLQLEATILAPGSDTAWASTTSRLARTPGLTWSAGEPTTATAPSDEIMHVDGERVSVEATFTDQMTGATTNGTLEATGP